MVHIQEVEDQLKAVDCNFRFFGRPEVRELAKILRPGEKIAQAVNGFYEGGFALLCVTDQRLLLIDRKPMLLTLEDLRFDMIAEIDFNHRLLNASVRIYSINKALTFTSWNHQRLRLLVENLQHHVLEMRNRSNSVGSQFAAALAKPQQSQPSLRSRYLQPHLLRPKLARLALIGSAGAAILPAVTSGGGGYSNTQLAAPQPQKRTFWRW